ncbi:Alcohol dehydrogenase-like 6 [Morella rubra]|uniref:Alcohol dehydrogenase-like 6 n=1 Tax=Morella rubra TaxID=262757 RepID=A0A6A1VJB7_9ROSI|nr:Alcohol dehydrogenase-like 6 [Morella rubra]
MPAQCWKVKEVGDLMTGEPKIKAAMNNGPNWKIRIVESVGEGVTEFEEGDSVLTVFIGECMKCTQCTSGKSNICEVLGLERRGVMHSDQSTRFSINGKPVFHYCAVSSFSEYTVVHSGCAVKVSPFAPLEKICLLSCGVAAGLGAAWNVADISKGSTVVIFGLGTVGLSVAQGAKLRGASKIIGVDTNPEKGEKAKAFGTTEFLNPNDCDEPIQQVIKRITCGGADYSFECIGDTEMVTTALQSCCDGWGLTVTLGVPKEKPEVKAHYGLFLTGRTLKGTLFGGWKPKSDLPSLVDMYTKKVSFNLHERCYDLGIVSKRDDENRYVFKDADYLDKKTLVELLVCSRRANRKGLGAAWNVADISKGSTVVIFGLGTVGLSVAQGAKLRGASKIIGVDTNPEKGEKAKAFGTTEFLNPNDCDEPIQQVIKRITCGGADYSFECIGDTEMVTTALQSCCDGWGLTVTLGVPKEKPEVKAHYGLFLTGRTLKGTLFGGWKPKSDLPSLVDMYTKKEIEIDELITHNIPFEDINKAFDLMSEDEGFGFKAMEEKMKKDSRVGRPEDIH